MIVLLSLVLPRGNDSRSFRLSAGCSALGYGRVHFVAHRNRGFPAYRKGTSVAQADKSGCGARSRVRTWECRVWTDALGLLAKRAKMVHPGGVEPPRLLGAAASEAAASAFRHECLLVKCNGGSRAACPLPKRCSAVAARIPVGADWGTDRTSRLSLTRRVLCPMS